MKTLNTTPLAACLGAVALASLAACGDRALESGGGKAARPPAVEAVPARTGSLPLEEELSGVVRARNQVAIRPEINGSVVAVLARNGEAVEAGQALVRLDDATLREQLRRARADLSLAEATAAEAKARLQEIRARVVRMRALAAEGLASELDLETMEAQVDAARAGAAQAGARVEQAEATVQERRSALARTTVVAPVAGRVGQRDVEIGMVVGPSTTLFMLGDFDELIVEVPLTQEMLRDVEVGTPVMIGTRDPASPSRAAAISRISPFLEAASFSTTAEIDVSGGSGGLRPGMFVTVRVLHGTSLPATLVPASAIWEDPRTGETSVFVVEEAAGLREPDSPGDEIPEKPRRVVPRPVEVLAEGRGQVGVRGVGDGEWVITLGQHLLLESLRAAGDGATEARVRPTSWSHVLRLESLQREDLLKRFLAKQRVVARALGAGMPESTALVDEVMRAHEESMAAPGPSGGGR